MIFIYSMTSGQIHIYTQGGRDQSKKYTAMMPKIMPIQMMFFLSHRCQTKFLLFFSNFFDSSFIL